MNNECPDCNGYMDDFGCTVCGLSWDDVEAAADKYDEVTSDD